MSIKRKKNFEESQHVETSLSLLPINVDEDAHPCFPPTHEVEEVTSLNDEEFIDRVEVALATSIPA
jgi:hypothetical protein